MRDSRTRSPLGDTRFGDESTTNVLRPLRTQSPQPLLTSVRLFICVSDKKPIVTSRPFPLRTHPAPSPSEQDYKIPQNLLEELLYDTLDTGLPSHPHSSLPRRGSVVPFAPCRVSGRATNETTPPPPRSPSPRNTENEIHSALP